jgi:hypothetical protein
MSRPADLCQFRQSLAHYERNLDELIETLEPVFAELPATDQPSAVSEG